MQKVEDAADFLKKDKKRKGANNTRQNQQGLCFASTKKKEKDAVMQSSR